MTTMTLYGKPRVSKSLLPKPNYDIRLTFNRYERENPDLPIEDILEMTAAHHSITVSVTISALWG